MLRNLTLSITAVMLLSGCHKSGTIREYEQVNRWIYEIMEKNYLWAGEMPETEELALGDIKPHNFFRLLLYSVSGDIDRSDTYSEITFLGAPEDHPDYVADGETALLTRSYHFGFEIRKAEGPVNFGQILYVVPGSPAERAGIKRGDCFQVINGTNIRDYTKNEFNVFFESISTAVIEFIYPEEKTVSLRKEYYNDNPVHFDTVFELSPPTGYLVYNHFTDGDGETYYKQLQRVFERFNAAAVENIIVDLRYNTGGELTAARKMCSLLAPPAALGDTYLYKEYRSSYGRADDFTPETLYSAPQVAGYNCGDVCLYIIGTKNTASASELVIHCLRAIYGEHGLKFVQVGETTTGKNLGGQTFAQDRYEWMLNPITLRVHNKHKVSGYESGLVPDISEIEIDTQNDRVQTASGEYVIPIADWGEVGRDRLLTAAMNDIYGYGGWVPTPLPGGAYLSSSVAVPAFSDPVRTSTTIRSRNLVERREGEN